MTKCPSALCGEVTSLRLLEKALCKSLRSQRRVLLEAHAGFKIHPLPPLCELMSCFQSHGRQLVLLPRNNQTVCTSIQVQLRRFKKHRALRFRLKSRGGVLTKATLSVSNPHSIPRFVCHYHALPKALGRVRQESGRTRTARNCFRTQSRNQEEGSSQTCQRSSENRRGFLSEREAGFLGKGSFIRDHHTQLMGAPRFSHFGGLFGNTY